MDASVDVPMAVPVGSPGGRTPMARRHVPPNGWATQAFQFALDLTDEQRSLVNRQFGGRRVAFNWTLRTLRADIERYHTEAVETDKPSHFGMRKRWNEAKHTECIDRSTGALWWPEVSKEAFSNGVRDAVEAYWRWQRSRQGRIAGRRVGFPRFKKRGRDQDRYTITTGSFGLADRRHITMPRIGVVRLHQNARRLERLIGLGRAKVLSMTVRRHGDRVLVSLHVDVMRPQRHHKPNQAASRVGVDVGVRRLATVASSDGEILERVDNPAPLTAALCELRRLCRQRSRRTPGSRRYWETKLKISVLHTRIGNIRKHHIAVLTTNLAKTHGEIVVEGLEVAGMLQQRGLNGARTRRRGLADAALAEHRRQLRYKCRWYGSELVEVDRFFPSSKTCHACGNVQDIGWAEHWTCDSCVAHHQRDDNAAVNLARWTGDLGSVGAPVKRGAKHKTGPRPAVGDDTPKNLRVQPRDEVRAG